MELPDDAPKTPKLYFIAADVLLIAVAALIALRSGTPLPPAAIYAISGCVLAGALLLVLPFLLDYNRRQEMLLTDRQNALEALARTTSSAVEQASIAVSGLNEVADLAQKHLKLADQLPQKLHERINEFKALHDEAMTAELESLQQEVNTLRASEAEKLESAADKIQRAANEFAKLEQVVRAQVATLDDAAKQAEQRIASAASKAIENLNEGLARTSKESDARLKASGQPASPTPGPAPAPAAASVAADVSPSPAKPATDSALSKPSPQSASSVATVESRVIGAVEVDRSAASAPPRAVTTKAASAPATASESPAPAVSPPSPRKATSRRSAAETQPALFAELTKDEAVPDTASSTGRTRSAETDDTAQLAPDEAQPEPALSSDGQTRLIVTAYIGIGNKLFVRGDGPGLSWDRGVPLQFVSIGKWRWETADATRPISLKLYKNDQVECVRLGTIQLEPGHQQELTANF